MDSSNRCIPAHASFFPRPGVRHLPDAERANAARQHLLPQICRRTDRSIAAVAARLLDWLSRLHEAVRPQAISLLGGLQPVLERRRASSCAEREEIMGRLLPLEELHWDTAGMTWDSGDLSELPAVRCLGSRMTVPGSLLQQLVVLIGGMFSAGSAVTESLL